MAELPYGPRGFRAAPLTYEEAKRIEAEKRWADIRMAQAADTRKRASSPEGIGPNERGVPPTLMDQATSGQPQGQGFGIGDFIKKNLPQTYDLFTGAAKPQEPDTRPALGVDNWQWAQEEQKRRDAERERVAKNRPDYSKTEKAGIATLPPVANPDAPVVPAAPAVPAAAPVSTDPLSGLDEQLATLKKFFGFTDDTNPAQAKADAYAEDDKRRTALLARLAFASGLTSAGGGSWKEIGKGFAGAAAVYDNGFQRYQDALQDGADRYQKGKVISQGREDALKEAAIKIRSNELSEARQRIAERSKMIDKFYSDEIEAAKSDLGADPNAIADIMRRRQRSLASGEYIAPGVNVADTE